MLTLNIPSYYDEERGTFNGVKREYSSLFLENL